MKAMRLSGLLLWSVLQSPSISSLSPSHVVAGDTSFWLTVNGSGFVQGAVVQLDGADRTTTYLSPTRIAALIAANDISRTGVRQVTASTPMGVSAALPLTVIAPPPVPKVLSLSPVSIAAGGPAFRLTVTGSGFAPTSLIDIDGETRATFEATATTLVTGISAEERTTPGIRRVRVVTPPPGGGTSAAIELRIGQR